jgi:hypothetical protein
MTRKRKGLRDLAGTLIEPGAFLAIGLVLAIALYICNRRLFSWGWPVLLGLLALAWGGSWFRSFVAGTRFYPRRLRIQFSLELALFHWNRSRRRGNGEERVLKFLEIARRIARGTPLGERIGRIVDGVRSTDPSALLTIGGELRTALEDLSVKRERSPFPRYWVLPRNCVVPLCAVFALIGVAATPALPTVKLWTISGFLQSVVLFAVAYEVLRWVGIITMKIHDVLSNSAFRTIMISSPVVPNVMSARAASLYPRIGHFVLILVEEEETESFEPMDEWGKYLFHTNLEGLPDILTAVAQHADLIVLDSTDETLAAQVRASTNLPVTRYLALSSTGTVPQGYAWIEPLAFRVPQPSAHSPADDPYKIGVGPVPSLWTFWLLQVFLLSSVALFRMKDAAPLAVLIGLAAFAGYLPNLLRVLRRSSISRSTLRIPRAPKASHNLVPRLLERRIWIGTALLFLAALWLIRSPILYASRHHDFSSFLKYMTLLFVVVMSYQQLVWGSLFAFKSWIDWNFRFLVLRRNARRFGFAHKAFIMATCGRYGQVISLRDDTLDQTDEDFGEWRESRLGYWFSIFSEIESTLKPFNLLHTWQRQILIELEVADFAVFDWIDEITENMQWELRNAAERLPAHRMLIVYRPENHDAVERIIASCAESLSGRPHCLETARGPDDEYIWSDHHDFDQAFSACLDQALSTLVVEPRGNFSRVAIGTWPYPR